MTPVEIRAYRGILDAIVARRHELGLSQAELDAICGFQDGYVSKLEIGPMSDPLDRRVQKFVGKKDGRGLGDMSLPTILDGLKLRIVVMPAEAPTIVEELVAQRMIEEKERARQLRVKAGRIGAARRNETMTPDDRRRSARKAARARWRKRA